MVALISFVLINRNSNNICKGYANVGIIGNLENQISSISSVPATYDVSIQSAYGSTILEMETLFGMIHFSTTLGYIMLIFGSPVDSDEQLPLQRYACPNLNP